MSFVAVALFGYAFLISVYAILITLAQKWPRIEAVALAQGNPPERIIRCGSVRYTGQRLRLVIVNELDVQPVQKAFKFPHAIAA